MVAPTGEFTAQAPTDKDHKLTVKQKIGLGLGMSGLAASIVSYGIVKAAEDTRDKMLETLTEPTPSTSQTIDTPSTSESFSITPSESTQLVGDTNHDGKLDKAERVAMDPSDYAKYIDEETRVSDQASDIRKSLHTAWDKIQTNLNEQEKQILYMPDLSKPLAQWSDQDYLNYETLAIFLVTNQIQPKAAGTLSEEETRLVNEGIQGLSVITKPGTNAYDTLSQWAVDHPGVGYVEVFKAIPSSMTDINITNVTAESVDGNVTVGSEGGRVVCYQSMVDGSRGVTLFANRSTIPVSETTYESLDMPGLQGIIKKYAQHQ